MSLAYVSPELAGVAPGGFEAFDRVYQDERNRLSTEDALRFGRIQLAYSDRLDTSHLRAPGNVMTNPCEVLHVDATTAHNHGDQYVTFLRDEPERNHLGHTWGIPVWLDGLERLEQVQDFSQPDLPQVEARPFHDADPVEGEDVRATWGVKRISPITGTVEVGWLLSSVIAHAVKDNPEEVDYVEHVFRFCRSLKEKDMEVVARLRDPQKIREKNNIPVPVSLDPNDRNTKLLGFVRPKPDMGLVMLDGIEQLEDMVTLPYVNLTAEFLADVRQHAGPDVEVHVGPNTVHHVPGRPGELKLNSHEAARHSVRVPGPNGEITQYDLNYRTAEYRLILPNAQYPRGLFYLVGNHIMRHMLPDSPSKPPHGDVRSFENVGYGSTGMDPLEIGGQTGFAIGLSDTDSAYGIVKRVAADPRILAGRPHAGGRHYTPFALAA